MEHLAAIRRDQGCGQVFVVEAGGRFLPQRARRLCIGNRSACLRGAVCREAGLRKHAANRQPGREYKHQKETGFDSGIWFHGRSLYGLLQGWMSGEDDLIKEQASH